MDGKTDFLSTINRGQNPTPRSENIEVTKSVAFLHHINWVTVHIDNFYENARSKHIPSPTDKSNLLSSEDNTISLFIWCRIQVIQSKLVYVTAQ